MQFDVHTQPTCVKEQRAFLFQDHIKSVTVQLHFPESVCFAFGLAFAGSDLYLLLKIGEIGNE